MRILYPPRPAGRFLPSELPSYDESGNWICQRKFNGTNVIVNISPKGTVGILNRHGVAPKQFELTNEMKQQFLSLKISLGKEYWFQAELLNNKTSNEKYKSKMVLFDILQAGNYFFQGPTIEERLQLLNDICGNPSGNDDIACYVSENIWLAQTWETNFVSHYDAFIDMQEIEGLVLKRRGSVIDSFGTKEYECDWMIRCRKPHKNYRF